MKKVKLNGNHTCEDPYVILSSVTDGVLSVDAGKNIVFINRAAQRLTGWNQDQVIGQPLENVFNIINAKTREKIEFPFDWNMYDCRKIDLNDWPLLITKSGDEIFVSVSWSAVNGAEGQGSGAVITFQDITGYVQVQEKLRIEHNNFRMQFRYAPVGMAIADEDAIIKSANDYFIDLCGGRTDSVIGKKLGKALGCLGCINRPCGEGEECEGCIVRESIIQVARTKIPFRNAERRYQLVRDGSTIIRYLRFNLVPLSTGGRTNTLISVDDMTEYRIMEERIKKSRDFYLTLFEGFPAMIWRTDAEKGIDYVNKKWLEYTGKTMQQERGRQWMEEMHPEDVTKCKELYKDAFEKKEYFEYQCRMKGADGEYRWFDGYASPYLDLGGNFAGYIGVSHDITEQKQVEQEMHRAVEATKAALNAKSEFLTNMSHEMRTPLNGILGMIDLTLLTELTEEQRDNLSTAKTCAASLLGIINDVLDFSKMETGKLYIEQVEFDFTSLMEETVKEYYHRAKKRGIELTCQLPIGIPDVLVGDPNRLQQVLHNLLGNAVKFTDKGHINLIIEEPDSSDQSMKLRFSVEDTGIGISPDEMDRLFTSFSQIDGSLTRRHGGTGLGLVISKRLIEMMGGALRVESEKGKGSTFSFTLEFKRREAGGIAGAGTGSGFLKTAKTGIKILLVEDDRINQLVIGRMLCKMGHEPDVADCGSDALRLLEQKKYDLCLVDVQMPGLDGIQAVAVIRKNEQKTGRHLPVIAITSYALKGDRERLLAMGMDECIAKPFSTDELFELLERLLYRQTGISSPEPSPVKSTAINKLNSYIRDYAQEIEPAMNEISRSLEELEYAIMADNMQKIEKTANNVKRLASLVDADKVKNLAFRIQLAARRSDRMEANRLCRKIAGILNKYSVKKEEMEE